MSKKIRPLSIVYNEKSGFRHNKDQISDQMIFDRFTNYGFDVKPYEIHAYANMQALMQEVILRHQSYEDCGIVVAAGGDGTLNSVAQYLRHTHIVLGILPLGTFNYVARFLNIPLGLSDAIEVIATGQNKSVHVACINEYIYLNNASFGLYPLFIKKREKYNHLLGRLPFNAYSSALDVLIRDRKELKLEIYIDGQKFPVKTPLVFFGNNQLQLSDFGLKIAKAAEEGLVAGVIAVKSDKLSLFKMVYQFIQGKLDQAKDVYSFSANKVLIKAKRSTFTVALDGELATIQTPIQISIDHDSLLVRVLA
ncbi:diacylglycerol kinase [Acinetobacter sp. NCu2D-2]|uniref:diacylglycerol/lipid kinase family protein n=1 Tax=Acinetobacter sp. NCu2D-2 TaxID=1608473 RepID=UPI0007CDB497|nr:diacylglycerol kinase family protein [Acinetobacter sp. NCu2D-2]ANF81368.1 diacylglycerol kinase [Acinetobacter sp. NCu2D-2]